MFIDRKFFLDYLEGRVVINDVIEFFLFVVVLIEWIGGKYEEEFEVFGVDEVDYYVVKKF